MHVLVMHMCMCKVRMHMYMCCAGGAATAGGAAAAGAWKAQVTDSYFAVVLRAPVSENVVHSEIVCFRERRERIGLVINDLPTVESKAPSQFGGVLLASVRSARAGWEWRAGNARRDVRI